MKNPKKLTQQEMLRAVKDSPKMSEMFEKELNKHTISIGYGGQQSKINGKRKGIQRTNNFFKQIAQQVYMDYNNINF